MPRNGCLSAGSGAGSAAAQSEIPTPTTATAAKAGARPTMAAALPRTGPSIAPKTAALSMMPINSPRLSSGARVVSHVNAATHESELPNPPTNRASTSTHAASASPNARQVRTSSRRMGAILTLELYNPTGVSPTERRKLRAALPGDPADDPDAPRLVLRHGRLLPAPLGG